MRPAAQRSARMKRLKQRKRNIKIGFIARHQKSISRIPNKMDEQIIH
jgi:hypothetical protein